jgi:hypothetical protein
MYAVEFQAIIKDGHIEVPPEYQGNFSNGVRVILLQADSQSDRSTIIDRLMESPIRLKDFHPLVRDDIYER